MPSSNIRLLTCLRRTSVSPGFCVPILTPVYSVGIVPSNKTTYTLSQLLNALKMQTGAVPYLGCGFNGTVLQEVWYFSHVFGTVRTFVARCSTPSAHLCILYYVQEQYGHFKTLDSVSRSTCSSTGPIWYYERARGSEHEVRFLP